MPIANVRSKARRVTSPEGDPRESLSGGGGDGRTPAGEPTRGYLKLSDAATAFNFDFRGKTVLDIGSSTGGFTEYALGHGAAKVIAVEKGTNQMKSPLRYDPRIELHEKTDIFDFALADSQKPDVIVADVSFLSLTKVLRYAKIKLARSDTDFLVMLKPQFEAQPQDLNNGVVKNDRTRRDIIKHFEQWLGNNGFVVINKRDNSLKGRTGNQERFYLLRPAKSPKPPKPSKIPLAK